jgi:pimeloyl-ACP methyl ester carboxylesterase
MIGTTFLMLAAQAATLPQTLVDVGGGRRIALHCAGTGGPAVILVPGLGDDYTSWEKVQPDLATHVTTCAFDRAGNGASDNAMEPQDAAQTTSDLEAALAGAGIGTPYVLVGHSIGSFESLLFAFRHPSDVAGIVLVDPTAPHEMKRLTAAAPRLGAMVTSRMDARNDQLSKCIVTLRAGHPDDQLCDEDMAAGTTSQRLGRAYAALTLMENFERSSDRMDAERKSLGHIPLIVLSAGKRPTPPPDLADEAKKAAAELNAMRAEFAALSSNGEVRVVEGAGHYIQQADPDAVIDTVIGVVDRARR